MKTETADYSKLTTEEFDAILQSLVSKMGASQILAIGDVYTILAEELNNEVLSEWERKNPALAFPNQYHEKDARLVGNANEGWAVEVWSDETRLSRENFGSLTMAEQRLEDVKAELDAEALAQA